MKTVAELEAYIEGRFAVGVPTEGRLAVTGEPYVVIGHESSDAYPLIPGVVREGMACDDFGFGEEEAVGAALSAFDAYAEGKTGTLYWRRPPVLDALPGRGLPLQYRVYMRCLISDKPVMKAAA